MYSFSDREHFLNSIISFFQNCSAFEGLIQIGSGAIGFADIYSDIDLMAGCFDSECIKNADAHLTDFFKNSGACHIEKRNWSNTALGMSVYYENGLSTDISFMPTDEIPIRSPLQKIIFSKTENFTDTVNNRAQVFEKHSGSYGLDDSVHYRFINELRYCEIALLRNQLIFADIALNNARLLLLAIETVSEGKKLHQFKAYNSLSEDFVNLLEKTYSKSLNKKDIASAKEKLLALYVDTVKKCDFLTFDNNLLKLLGCFE